MAEPTLVLPASQHPWARFEPGAWRRLRITSETFDEAGQFVGRSVTERLESLLGVGQMSCTVRSETIVEVGGRRAPGPVEERRIWFSTDSTEPPESIVPGEPSGISLGGQVVPCDTWELLTPTEYGERREVLHYSATAPPHVLRRERIESVDGEQRSEWIQSVVRMNVPAAYGQGIGMAWHTATTRLLVSGGRMERFSICSDTAPGGLLSQSEIEYDVTGRRVRWTVTRLLASGASEAEKVLADGSRDEPKPRRFLRFMRRAEEVADQVLE